MVWRDFAAAFLIGFVLPSVLLCAMVFQYEEGQEPQKKQVYAELPNKAFRNFMRLHREAASEESDLDTYLVGVVLAEMPAEFEAEALKAQAIAARTFTRKAYETGGKHGDGSVCQDPSCCQAYISPEDYLNQGGTSQSVEKVRAAVEATSGLVLTYDGELIEATYFSCSGGKTEDAAAVWGTDYPYLQSVDSPGEESARYYRDTVCYAPEEFAEILGTRPEGEPKDWFGLVEYTHGGSVSQMVIGDVTFSGTQLRSLLGLRSAAFDLEVADGQVIITTRGYGHRVGMSQYGADAMALSGSTYAEILAHYYPGTELTLLKPDGFSEAFGKCENTTEEGE